MSGLQFHPSEGQVLICKYPREMSPPEMVSVHPVVVVGPRRRTSNLVTLVALSSKKPNIIEPWHIEVPEGFYPGARGPMWFKCDMINTFAIDRLDRICYKPDGKTRTYAAPTVDTATLKAILRGVAAAVGIRLAP